MAYDPATQQVVLYGGYTADTTTNAPNGYASDTWLWNGSSWVQDTATTASAPGKLGYAMMAYDASSRQLVLFGGQRDLGCDGNGFVNNTWVWNGTGWTQQANTSAPSPRAFASMSYDPANGGLVLFGGQSATGTCNPPVTSDAVSHDGTFLWNGNAWSNLAATGPSPRYGTAMSYDPSIGELVLFGGTASAYGTGPGLGDTWLWNGTAWSPSAATGPSARFGALLKENANLAAPVLFAGSSSAAGAGSTPTGTWTFTGSAWVKQAPATTPAARFAPGGAYDGATGQPLLFGGADPTAGSNLSGTYTYQASPPAPAPAPTPAPTVTGLAPAAGTPAGGTSVTIDGSGFSSGVSAVNFGSATASSVTVVSDSQLTAVSPAGSGTVDVTVTGSGGTSAISTADQFTYRNGYIPLAPSRILDTRSGAGGLAGPLAPGRAYTFTVPASVPADATAVAMNVTAVDPAGDGYLQVYPAGGSPGASATINYTPGHSSANYALVRLTSARQIELYSAGTAVNVLFDLTGYFTAGSNVTPITPARVVDSRTGAGGARGPLAAGSTTNFRIAGLGGVPADANAVAVNVAAVAPSTSGYLQVLPVGGSRGATSTVNFVRGQDRATFALVPLNGGALSVFNPQASVNVVLDVLGYVRGAGDYAPVSPYRVLDTRTSGQTQGLPNPLARNTAYHITLPRVPAGATAVALNVTAIMPTGAGYLQVLPDGGALRATSTINYIPGQTVANFVIVSIPADRQLTLYSADSPANVAVDVLGYVMPAG